jgi:L-fuculose-phosphate aldolase
VSTDRGLRLRVVQAARRLSDQGMNPGRSGNLSVRVAAGFLVTPSGAPYDTLHPDDLVLLIAEGALGRDQRTPSTEWRLHRDLYARRPEVAAVVHTHSPFATTMACLRRPIPSFHYEVAFAGGHDIRCADYATFGTQEFSNATLAAIEGRKACLLANHGAVAVGASIENARELAEKVEALARLYWQALQVADPPLLDAAEMDRVLAKFKDYGQH